MGSVLWRYSIRRDGVFSWLFCVDEWGDLRFEAVNKIFKKYLPTTIYAKACKYMLNFQKVNFTRGRNSLLYVWPELTTPKLGGAYSQQLTTGAIFIPHMSPSHQ
jgi:hypothetical protein